MIELSTIPLLSCLLALPLFGALCVACMRDSCRARRLALGFAVLTLLLSLLVIACFDARQSGFQMIDTASWIPGLHIRYRLGVDGISLFFLPATALLNCGAMIARWRVSTHATSVAQQPSSGVYFALLLLLEAATLGAFCALDTIFFFLCWELALLPIYFLTSLWGNGVWQQTAAVRYFFVMLAGGVPLLFGFLILAQSAGWVFDLPTLLHANVSRETQSLLFLLFLIGCGVKVPLVPLHTWLPAMAMGAPAAVTALLVGLKLGAYALLRFAIPLAPFAAHDLHWLLAGLGTLAILYGAVQATAQSNLRGVLAYLSLSHIGLAVLGLASFSVSALQGVLLLLLNFSMATGGAFLLLAFLQRRTGVTDIAQLGGIVQRMPLLTGFFLFFALASVGMPGTSGFPAELLIVVTVLPTHTGAALGALFGLVVGAGALFSVFRLAFFGVARRAEILAAEDLLPRELAVAVLFALPVLVVGLHPAFVLTAMQPAIEAWVTLGR